MHQIYDAARQLKPRYTPTAFRQMLVDRGGLGTADHLLATSDPSGGFTELYLRGKENLMLSVEYVVLESPWNTLFSDAQLSVARRRLHDVEVEPPSGSEGQSTSGAAVPSAPVTLPSFVDQFDVGTELDTPTERVRTFSLAPYPRSVSVRQAALARASGSCEWCHQPGFRTIDGGVFLETHHIVPLSEGGADVLTNVVAVCPTHHREAHFGADRDAMRRKFLTIADSSRESAV
jgi:5-methylcytosine-specific restriction protein A